MKLFIVSPEFDPARGGVGRFVSEFAETLGPGRAETFFAEDLLRPHWIFSVFRIGKRLFSNEEKILFVNHVLPLGTIAYFFSVFFGVRYAVMLHGLDYLSALRFPKKRWLMKRILKRAMVVATNSEALARDVSHEIRRNDLVVVHPWLPTSPVLLPHVGRQERTLFSLGRLVKRKGFQTIIRAMPLLPGFTLRIAGDGPERATLEALAQELGIADRVTFLGWISEEAKAVEFQSSVLFVLPTINLEHDREGFGIVFLEAQSYGLPIIGGEGIGVSEAIAPEYRALAVSYTPERLAEAILAVIDAPVSHDAIRAFAASFDREKTVLGFWNHLLERIGRR